MPQDFGLKDQDYTYLVAERARLRGVIERQSSYAPWIVELVMTLVEALLLILISAGTLGSVGGLAGFLVGGVLAKVIVLGQAELFSFVCAIIGGIVTGGYGAIVSVTGLYRDKRQRFKEIRQRGQYQKQLSAPEYAKVELYEKAVGRWNYTQQKYWKSLRGTEFERALARLYRRMGYSVRQTKASGDEGIDLILSQEGKTTVVQCKGHEKPVGVGAVRDLYGTMMHTGADGAVLACPAGFTKAVVEFVSNKPIRLVSASELVEMAESVSP